LHSLRGSTEIHFFVTQYSRPQARLYSPCRSVGLCGTARCAQCRHGGVTLLTVTSYIYPLTDRHTDRQTDSQTDTQSHRPGQVLTTRPSVVARCQTHPWSIHRGTVYSARSLYACYICHQPDFHVNILATGFTVTFRPMPSDKGSYKFCNLPL